MTKQEAKEKIKKLIERYKQLTQNELKAMNEEDTKGKFIRPLFEALGWDFEEDVSHENKVSNKRADYNFHLKGKTRFFLEAKPLKANLDDPTYAKQATNYAWLKNVNWAFLSDFEGIRVFYPAEKGEAKSCFKIDYQYYIKDFDRLWMLSKEAFEKDLFDHIAEEWGAKPTKLKVSEQLANDLNSWRLSLSENFKIWNKELKDQELDEGVQRILDRFIFIRTCEDRGLENSNLMSLYRIWQDNGRKGNFLIFIRPLFEEYQKIYDSGLFEHHPSENWNLDSDLFDEIIEGLYKSPEGQNYNFNDIDADVLGSVYEQYLGHLLHKSKTDGDESKKKRKSQGIYYTPTFIVDYIVENTLGKILKEKSPEEIKNLKILDLACGSGSFLIKAFDYLNKYQFRQINKSKFNTDTKLGQIEQTLKDKGKIAELSTAQGIEILRNNIYGVDLDDQAIEITQLNLLLKAAQTKHKLPHLENIKCGNSLIDDKKVAGEKAFDWNNEFPEVMGKGRFDIIIGNPPYIRMQSLNKNEVEYFNKKYESSENNYDIYILFLEKGFKLLKEGGILGLILPHKFFQGKTGNKIRKFIYENKALYKVVDFTTNQIFENATTYTCLLFLSKTQNNKFYYKKFNINDNFKSLEKITFNKIDLDILNKENWNFNNDAIQGIISNIYSQKCKFKDITEKIFKGSSTGNDKIFLLDLIKENENTFTVFSSELNKKVEIEKEILKPFIYGEDVRRYYLLKFNKLLLFPYITEKGKFKLISIDKLKKNYPLACNYFNETKKELLKRKIEIDNNNFYKYSALRSISEYEKEKILIPDMLIKNRISLDTDGIYYHGPAIHSVIFKEKTKNHLLFYLSILNSKLFWFFISNTSTALRGNAYRLTPTYLNNFCFPEINIKNDDDGEIYNELVKSANRMLKLNRELQKEKDGTNNWNRIKSEIKKTDKLIDQKVYELYGLNKKEIDIIENSFHAS